MRPSLVKGKKRKKQKKIKELPQKESIKKFDEIQRLEKEKSDLRQQLSMYIEANNLNHEIGLNNIREFMRISNLDHSQLQRRVFVVDWESTAVLGVRNQGNIHVFPQALQISSIQNQLLSQNNTPGDI